MTFKITNTDIGLFSHVGVQEFSAEEGVCYIPFWLLEHLAIPADGGIVEIANVTLPTGNFVKLQPVSKTFLDIHNHRAVLEMCLRKYATLTKGDVISIEHAGKVHRIDIKECKPADAILIIEADVQVDFEAPKDYVEPPPVPRNSSTNVVPVAKSPSLLPATQSSASAPPLMVQAKRVDGKVVEVPASFIQQKEDDVEPEDFDDEPWKKALVGGVRTWDHGFDMLVREGRVPGVLGNGNSRRDDFFKGTSREVGMD